MQASGGAHGADGEQRNRGDAAAGQLAGRGLQHEQRRHDNVHQRPQDLWRPLRLHLVRPLGVRLPKLRLKSPNFIYKSSKIVYNFGQKSYRSAAGALEGDEDDVDGDGDQADEDVGQAHLVLAVDVLVRDLHSVLVLNMVMPWCAEKGSLRKDRESVVDVSYGRGWGALAARLAAVGDDDLS